MLQRIQTLFLLGVAICMGASLAFPIWTESNPDQTRQIVMTAFKMEQVALPYDATVPALSTKSTWYIALLAALAVLIALYEVFQYKNRLTQMKLSALNALIMASCLGISFYQIFQFEKLINPDTQGTFLVGFFLPAGAMIMNIIANRFIKKDEDLIRSVDRIR